MFSLCYQLVILNVFVGLSKWLILISTFCFGIKGCQSTDGITTTYPINRFEVLCFARLKFYANKRLFSDSSWGTIPDFCFKRRGIANLICFWLFWCLYAMLVWIVNCFQTTPVALVSNVSKFFEFSYWSIIQCIAGGTSSKNREIVWLKQIKSPCMDKSRLK